MTQTCYAYSDGRVIELILFKNMEIDMNEKYIHPNIQPKNRIIKIYNLNNTNIEYKRLGSMNRKFIVYKSINFYTKIYTNLEALIFHNKTDIDKRILYEIEIKPSRLKEPYENEPKFIQKFNRRKQLVKTFYLQNSQKVGVYRKYASKSEKVYLTVECNYNNNKLHGKYTLYDEFSNILEEYNYNNNMKNGEYKIWYRNNRTLKEVGNYLNGRKINYITYFPILKTNAICVRLIDNNNNIYKKEVYNNLEILLREEYLKYDSSNMILDGKCTYYYDIGNVPEEHSLSDRLKEQCSFNVHKICFYKDGKLDGDYIEKYESGNVPEEHSFSARLKEHCSFNVHKICSYKDGKLDGDYIEKYESGNVHKICSYKEGYLMVIILKNMIYII